MRVEKVINQIVTNNVLSGYEGSNLWYSILKDINKEIRKIFHNRLVWAIFGLIIIICSYVTFKRWSFTVIFLVFNAVYYSVLIVKTLIVLLSYLLQKDDLIAKLDMELYKYIKYSETCIGWAKYLEDIELKVIEV